MLPALIWGAFFLKDFDSKLPTIRYTFVCAFTNRGLTTMPTFRRRHFYRSCLILVVLLSFSIGNHIATPVSAAPQSLQDAVDRALGNKGAVRVPHLPTTQQAKLLASDKANIDQFGYSVALSGDGTTAIVGAASNDSGSIDHGAVYVFVRNASNWLQQGKLLSTDFSNYDYFGWSVSISTDGNTAVIGANGNDSPGVTDHGAGYVFVRSGSNWTQQAKLLANDGNAFEHLGTSASISGDGNTVLLGAHLESDTGTNSNGAVYVYTRSGTTWTQQAKLLANDKATDDNFGFKTSISSDGNTALIGAHYEDSGGVTANGAAYVFERTGSNWTQQAKLLATDFDTGDVFGYSVALSSSGNIGLIGAIFESNSGFTSNGAAYIFARSGANWSQQAKLLATDRASNDGFGISTSLSANGDIAFVGAYVKDDAGISDSGAVYIFGNNGTNWVQQAKLTATDQAMEDYFGYSVSASANGSVLLIGAYLEDDSGTENNGAAYIFTDPVPTPTPSPTATNTPVPRTDTIGIYRPSNQTFYLRNSRTAGAPDIVVQYGYLCGGQVCNYPIMGDWNGDGVDTIGIYDRARGVFLLRNQNATGFPAYEPVMGNPGDQPLAGRWTPDMNHDGIGVFRNSNGILYLKKVISTGFSDYFAVMGNPGDVGLAGDWNSDGLDSVGVYRPSQSKFYLTNNNEPSGITFSQMDFIHGDGAQDKPFVGDWTGNAVSKPGLFRSGTFMLRNTLSGGAPDVTFAYGAAGDMPLAGKWIPGSQPNPRSVIVAPYPNPFGQPSDGDKAD
jgi:hypothetical protein